MLNDGFVRCYIFDVWNVSKQHLKSEFSRSEEVLNWPMNFCEEEICKFKIENFKVVCYVTLIKTQKSKGGLKNSH